MRLAAHGRMNTDAKNAMSHLRDDQLQAIEKRLADRETELRQRVLDAKAEQAERPSAQGPQVEDLGEGGEERFRTGIEHVEMLRDQEELTDIAAARERIAAGSYGDCVDCGQEIRVERLHAQPTAIRCVACQETYEKKHGSTLRYSS
jgi:RNA polymerase-binding transcription factor DksA